MNYIMVRFEIGVNIFHRYTDQQMETFFTAKERATLASGKVVDRLNPSGRVARYVDMAIASEKVMDIV